MLTLLRLTIFFLLLSFAVKNSGVATIHYYLGIEWELPLVVILFICFFAGSLFGYFSCLVQKLQNRK
ncbi:MAG: LapA family protein [Nitrosomonas sp.]|nr:LapA family protein [Nitrosomonas sp.]